ncbi:winged helix-turn-helix domain-containing protein [Stenotrophomonas sp. Marseille-Q4652]|uniref:winged helix-turn-helix domain-containing protein n=1 Tax=Stenotrophomonas sp. Marseille-Q4652 TaxID=2866595 RepID=UPI001CE3CCEF|nr:winged helix-turn-helix domain-containing protein [Stenotrophomonas sp. Marseille-Q4652]
MSDRIAIGQCIVVLSAREVHAPNARRPHRITPKALGVLLALVRAEGRVVTREELFAGVWAGTAPTNDVLTQAVTQLRKAFAAGEEAPYIETIAKTGYRLLAPVQWLDEPVAASMPVETAPAAEPVTVPTQPAAPVAGRRARRARQYLPALVIVVLLCATLGMGWLLWQRDAGASAARTAEGPRVVGSPGRPYRLITASPGFEVNPTVSPDGSLVAYATEEPGSGTSTIHLQATGNVPARRLVVPPPGHMDRFPAWSPDGRQIAFARFGPQGSCEVLIVSATGGAPRRAVSCDGTEMLSFDWTPAGDGLVFGTMTGADASRGIRLLDIASGRWTALDYPIGDGDFDYAPRFSPDGRHIGFVRNPQLGTLWWMPVTGGQAEPLTEDAAEIRGWSWLPDGAIVFGRRVDSEARLYRLDVGTRTLRDLGIDDAQMPAVSRAHNVLTFVHRQPHFGLYRVPLGGGPAERLFPSSGRDTQPMVSPDGEQLAFTSDRSGVVALWWGRPGQPDTVRMIEGVVPETRQPPAWSPDSRHLLLTGRDRHDRPLIHEVAPDSGQATTLPVPSEVPLQAIYGARENELLVVEQGGDGRMGTRLVLFDRSVTPWRRLAVLEGVTQAQFDRVRDRVLFTRPAGGLWQVAPDLDAASVQVLDPALPTRWRYRTWALLPDAQVAYLSTQGECASQFSLLSGPASTRCLDSTRLSSSNGFSAAPDGQSLYVAMAPADGTDIAVMEVQQEPRVLLSGFSKWLPLLKKDNS